MPDSGWLTVPVRTAADLAGAVEVFRVAAHPTPLFADRESHRGTMLAIVTDVDDLDAQLRQFRLESSAAAQNQNRGLEATAVNVAAYRHDNALEAPDAESAKRPAKKAAAKKAAAKKKA